MRVRDTSLICALCSAVVQCVNYTEVVTVFQFYWDGMMDVMSCELGVLATNKAIPSHDTYDKVTSTLLGQSSWRKV